MNYVLCTKALIDNFLVIRVVPYDVRGLQAKRAQLGTRPVHFCA